MDNWDREHSVEAQRLTAGKLGIILMYPTKYVAQLLERLQDDDDDDDDTFIKVSRL